MDCWTSYREFWFEVNQAQIHSSDGTKISEIATYLKNNPSLMLGIDASPISTNNSESDKDLSDQRVKAIRTALIDAGVPAEKIRSGAFGDAKLRRDQRVEVLFATAN